MAFQITQEWIINLSEDFERRVENEKLIFWKTGITVVAVVFKVPDDFDKFGLLNQIQEKIPETAIETLVSTKGEIVGLGYTQIHRHEGEKDRLSLYTFTASDTSCLQVAFYMDDPANLDWAKKVWETVLYHPEVNP